MDDFTTIEAKTIDLTESDIDFRIMRLAKELYEIMDKTERLSHKTKLLLIETIERLATDISGCR